MDRAAFLIEREALQERMEFRRQEVLSAIAERRNGFLPRLLRTGANVLFGMGPHSESIGWMSSLLWTVLAPMALGAAQRGGNVLVSKVIQGIFPGRSSK